MDTSPNQYPNFFAESYDPEIGLQCDLLSAALGGVVLNAPPTVVAAIDTRGRRRRKRGWSSFIDPEPDIL